MKTPSTIYTIKCLLGGLYQLTSQRNASSILVSVKDLFDLADYICEHRAELEAHRDES